MPSQLCAIGEKRQSLSTQRKYSLTEYLDYSVIGWQILLPLYIAKGIKLEKMYSGCCRQVWFPSCQLSNWIDPFSRAILPNVYM